MALKSILADVSTDAKSSSDLATKVLCTELSSVDRIWYEKCKKLWCIDWESLREWSVKCLWLHCEMQNVWPFFLVQIDADWWWLRRPTTKRGDFWRFWFSCFSKSDSHNVTSRSLFWKNLRHLAQWQIYALSTPTCVKKVWRI